MRIRINGWQRIGVILSFLWIVFVCGYSIYEYIQGANGSHYFVEMIKPNTPYLSNNFEKSPDEKRRILSFEEFAGPPAVRSFMFSRFVAAIIAPLVLVWVLAYLCVIAVRWVAAGFKSNDA